MCRERKLSKITAKVNLVSDVLETDIQQKCFYDPFNTNYHIEINNLVLYKYTLSLRRSWKNKLYKLDFQVRKTRNEKPVKVKY